MPRQPNLHFALAAETCQRFRAGPDSIRIAPSPGIEANHAIGTGVRSRTQDREPLSLSHYRDAGNQKAARQLDANRRHRQQSACRSSEGPVRTWRPARGRSASGRWHACDYTLLIVASPAWRSMSIVEAGPDSRDKHACDSQVEGNGRDDLRLYS